MVATIEPADDLITAGGCLGVARGPPFVLKQWENLTSSQAWPAPPPILDHMSAPADIHKKAGKELVYCRS